MTLGYSLRSNSNLQFVTNPIKLYISYRTAQMAGAIFLSQQLKKSTSIDFSSDFNKFIRNSYDEDPAKFKDAIREFNQLREASCIQVPDKHEASLDVLLRYFDQLNVIDTKLPISESQVCIQIIMRTSTREMFQL